VTEASGSAVGQKLACAASPFVAIS